MTRTLLIALSLSLSTPACAFEIEMEKWFKEEPEAPRKRPQVKGWVAVKPKPRPYITVDEPTDKTSCSKIVSVVGDQYATESGAKTEAEKAWMQTVRFLSGERFMDPSHAKFVQFACTRSSVGSIAGNTFHRCEMTALACAAPRVNAGSK